MSLVQKLAQGARRRTRSPEHDFHIRHRAYVIQPFMYHPVRPGETLKNILWQSRAVSDPLANPLIGWHLEYYYFYVQLQDAVAPGTEDSKLDSLWVPGAKAVDDWGAVQARLENYTMADPAVPDLTYNMYRRIIQEYFREEGETWNSAWKMSGALALARRNRTDLFEGHTANGGGTPDVTINIADGLTVQEVIDAMTDYAMLLDTSMGIVTNFNDYLASQGQGSFTDVQRAYRPELIRVVKEWTYPVNTVDPVTGTPTSAVSWAIAGRADKDRYFREPGFIVGLTVARPKAYRTIGNDPANFFKEYEHWIPQQSFGNPMSWWSGNFYNNDLFEYGTQFLNFDPSGTYKYNGLFWAHVDGTGATAGTNGVYPVETSVTAQLWKTSTSNNVRQDGKVQLNILTDLPKDEVLGDLGADPLSVAPEEQPLRAVGDLAREYLAKLQERRAGKDVKLPNVRAALEKLFASSERAS